MTDLIVRRLLVDHARAHGAVKRGAGVTVPLEDIDAGADWTAKAIAELRREKVI